MRKKQLLRIIVGLFAALFLIGCSSKTLTTSGTEYYNPHLIIENSSINGFLRLENIVDRVNNGGLMQIEARFVNTSNFNREVIYKVDWLDKDGFLIKNITTKWKRVLIQSNRNFVISTTSPNDKAVDYKIRINTPDSDDRARKDISNYEMQN